MGVVDPAANPETVQALLDTTWRVAEAEAARTDALDRKAATVATFASLVTTLTATLGIRFVERFETWWAAALFLGGLAALVTSASLALVALLPREYLALGVAYLKRFPTWSEIRKTPTEVRGAALRGIVEAVARERQRNDRKAGFLRCSFGFLGLGLLLIAVEAGTLAVEEINR